MPTATGTAFFVAPNRLVTNWHVVKSAKKIEVRDSSGKSVRIIGIGGKSTAHDLAVIVPDVDYTPSGILIATDKEPPMGARVYVLGSPRGLEYSLSDGIVSSVRDLDGRRVLQITAAISPGSSGSPVVNSEGEVVGVATFQIAGGQALNFAIPSKHIRELLSQPVEAVGIGTKADKTDDEAPVAPSDEIVGQLYEIFAERYAKSLSEQQTDRPQLRFGDREGSVGHIDGTLNVLQVLSGSEALLQLVDRRGHELVMFKISGVDLSNQEDDAYTKFQRNLIFAQFTTYTYTTVLGVPRTVFAVQCLDSELLHRKLQKHFSAQISACSAIEGEIAKLQGKKRDFTDRHTKMLSTGRNIERAREIRRDIRMYEPAALKRPDLAAKVERMRSELASLAVTAEQMNSYEQDVQSILTEIRRVDDEIRGASARLDDCRRKVPRFLQQAPSE